MTDQEFYNLIQIEVKEGRVREFFHKDYPELRGYDYTEQVKFKNEWNEINKLCRGLVFQIEPEIKCLNNPFPAIRNIEETEYTLESIKDQIDYINEKEDGSCIIVFWWDNSKFSYDDETLIVMTRGSFHSEQAIAARKLINSDGKLDNFITDYRGETLIFELVGPSNKNVCRTKYPKDELILLGHRSSFKDNSLNSSADNLNDVNIVYKISIPKNYKYDNSLYNNIVNSPNPNFEGVVITLKNGEKVKVKSDLYKKLHRLLTGVFTEKRKLDIWYSSIKKNLNQELESIPDEFFTEIKILIQEINNEYESFKKDLLRNYNLMYNRHILQQRTRKEIALEFPNYCHLLNLVFKEEINEEDIQNFFIKQKLKGIKE